MGRRSRLLGRGGLLLFLLVSLRGGSAGRTAIRPHGVVVEEGEALPSRTPLRPFFARQRLLAPVALALAALGSDSAFVAEGAPETLQDLFENLDVDKDGLISREEYMIAARETEEPGGEVHPQLLEWYARIFEKADLDKNEHIDRKEAEYLGLVARSVLDQSVRDGDPTGAQKAARGEPRTVAVLLGELDVDGDGKVSQNEFMKAIYTVAGEKDMKDVLDAGVVSWLEQIFARSDTNEDGLLNEEELSFATLMMQKDLAQQRVEITQDDLVEAMFVELDKDRDGSIRLGELADAAQREAERRPADAPAAKPSLLQRMHKKFAEVDTNGDRSLDRHEAANLAGILLAEGV